MTRLEAIKHKAARMSGAWARSERGEVASAKVRFCPAGLLNFGSFITPYLFAARVDRARGCTVANIVFSATCIPSLGVPPGMEDRRWRRRARSSCK